MGHSFLVTARLPVCMADRSQEDSLQALLSCVRALRAEAARCNQRRGLVLAGSRTWGLDIARTIVQEAAPKSALWIGDDAPAGLRSLDPSKAHALLGGEISAAVMDAHRGFDPDALGALSGALRGGGLLILLTPLLEAWPDFPDPQHARIAVHPYRAGTITGRFLRRIADSLREARGMLVVSEGAPPPPIPQTDCPPPHRQPADPDCLSLDQEQAVAAILKVASGHPHRPLVLTSDRGRGKSAALGIAAARLLGQRDAYRILVTGPSGAAVATLFRHAAMLLPDSRTSGLEIHHGESRLRFVAPDALLHERPAADLLLVDEAAALPAPLLERLLRGHSRIVFATTLHGYEGTGRGFAVRFRAVLDERTPGWRDLGLNTPVRWEAGDPVEAWTFHALMLDAAPAPEDSIREGSKADLRLQRLDRAALAADETELRELFGLLVLAHYRTTPNDLRHLLDGPNLILYVVWAGRHLAATALVAIEGGFDEELARAVFAGTRRPRGHLIPQSLAAHCGFIEAPRLRCARIVRIAVHPVLRRRGIGRRLVDFITQDAATEGMDLAGASFGASADLLRFWSHCGALPVRFGMTHGKTSGLRAAIVLRPLSPRGEDLYAQARGRFLDHLPHQLSDPLRDLEPEICAELLRNRIFAAAPRPSAQDWREIAACAFARRGYEDSLLPVWRLIRLALPDAPAMNGLTERQHQLLILRVVQRRSWPEVVSELELTGKAEALAVLRGALRYLFLRLAPPEALADARGLRLIDKPS